MTLNSKEKIEQICAQPFTSLEIDSFGDVFTCCPSYINRFNIGNIYKNENLQEIWYSTRAQELRSKILEGDYSFCNLELCRQKQLCPRDSYTEKVGLPKYITLAYDKECNLQCITCRDLKYKNSLEMVEVFNKINDNLLLPLLSNADILALSGAGEAFFSSHSRLLIKKIAKENKKLKFNINTNGLLFNQANCEALGIRNRINEVFVSIPALDETLYSKIMIGSNLSVVLENIKWMSKAQKEKEINKITINTVISSINYKEISKIVNFAKRLDINVTISQYCYWDTEFGKDFESLAIWEKNHKAHTKFVRELKKINYDKCFLSPLFDEIKNEKLRIFQF